MDIRHTAITGRLIICALVITSAAATAHAVPCAVTLSCPTNFAVAPGLKAPVRMVASGGASVWALDINYAIYQFNPTTRVFDQQTGSLVWIAVGGGTGFDNTDEAWGYDANGQTYHLEYSYGNPVWRSVPTPYGGLSGLVVGEGVTPCNSPEVWALGITRSIPNVIPTNVFRYNYCNSAWESVFAELSTISIGGGEVWGLDPSGQIWRFNTATGTQTQIPGTFSSLAVGADGVWGVNASRQVFQFNPAGQKFVQIPNISLTSVTAGGNGVWGQDASNNVYRYQAATRTFTICPMVLLRFLSVGSGGGVWGIDTGGNLRVFVTPGIPVGMVAK